jgi:hypothetical protein
VASTGVATIIFQKYKITIVKLYFSYESTCKATKQKYKYLAATFLNFK